MVIGWVVLVVALVGVELFVVCGARMYVGGCARWVEVWCVEGEAEDFTNQTQTHVLPELIPC
jgi:hypothetical protein